MTNVSAAIPVIHATDSPAIPHAIPTAKDTGSSNPPATELPSAMPGLPSALVAGANRICSVRNGMASARIGMIAAVSTHFSPRNVSTIGSAVAAMPT